MLDLGPLLANRELKWVAVRQQATPASANNTATTSNIAGPSKHNAKPDAIDHLRFLL
jgi:hypothetical protein